MELVAYFSNGSSKVLRRSGKLLGNLTSAFVVEAVSLSSGVWMSSWIGMDRSAVVASCGGSREVDSHVREVTCACCERKKERVGFETVLSITQSFVRYIFLKPISFILTRRGFWCACQPLVVA